MMQLDARELLRIELQRVLNLEALQGKKLKGVTTNSRTARAGEVFFAIRGEKFDGHHFVSEAFSRGCVAAVVEEGFVPAGEEEARFPLLYVKNTVHALGQFARLYRRKFDIPVIAITGSNGKTTTKEMVASVLAQKFTVLKTEGNLNNQIGVPQTLFRLEKKHEIAVLEIAMNHFGEIEYLCTVAEPTYGLITNIGPAHLEFLGTIAGVAKEKGRLFDWLETRGVAFVNTDDSRVVKEARKVRKKFTYGFQGKRVDVKGRFVRLNEYAQPEFSFRGHPLSRPYSVQLQTYGKHTIENALAAAAVGMYFRIGAGKIREALEKYKAGHQRMEVVKLHGVTIINDTYNANTASVLAALQTLAAMNCRGKRIVVLGDMLELGKASEREHRKVGLGISRLRIQYVLAYGPESKVIVKASRATHASHYENKSDLGSDLAKLVAPGDVVLVKGSRGMKMEEVVEDLTNHLRSREMSRSEMRK